MQYPLVDLVRLIRHCEDENLEVIICADSNAHHQVWGSADNNSRGITDSLLCRACLSDEETIAHEILECERLATYRPTYLATQQHSKKRARTPGGFCACGRSWVGWRNSRRSRAMGRPMPNL